MKALKLISNGVHSGIGTVKILAHRNLSMLERSEVEIIIMVALLTYHEGERLSQKNVSLCKNITDLSSSLRRDWRTEVIGKYPFLPMFPASVD